PSRWNGRRRRVPGGRAVVPLSGTAAILATRQWFRRRSLVHADLGLGELARAALPLLPIVARHFLSTRPALDVFLLSRHRCAGPGPGGLVATASAPGAHARAPGLLEFGAGAGRSRSCPKLDPTRLSANRVHAVPDQIRRHRLLYRATAGRLCRPRI